MNLLGIDYGEKILGLAYSEGILSRSLSEINIKETDRLKKICTSLQIEKIILGLPEGRLRPKVLVFAQTLKKILNLEIVVWDETLTSHEAIGMLIGVNKSRKKRQKKEHQVAAALILQSYLENYVK